jgi:hypothetical protein
MSFFAPKKQAPSSDQQKPSSSRPKKNLFSRQGGRPISQRRFNQRMMYARLRPAEKEYVKSVMKKFDAPYTRGITKEEFNKGLDEMKKNKRDRITDREIKHIKDAFK